jgi:hypothetical protein
MSVTVNRPSQKPVSLSASLRGMALKAVKERKDALVKEQQEAAAKYVLTVSADVVERAKNAAQQGKFEVEVVPVKSTDLTSKGVLVRGENLALAKELRKMGFKAKVKRGEISFSNPIARQTPTASYALVVFW